MNPGDTIVLKIKMKDFPKISRYWDFGRIAQDEESVVIVVAKVGYVNDWAAYTGWPLPAVEVLHNTDFPNMFSTEEGVARHGDKLFENDAREIFKEYPALLKLRYRG